VNGHFGAELRRFVLVQYHQGQVTVLRLVAQLRAIGIDVSKRQVMRMLISGQDPFVAEARDELETFTEYTRKAQKKLRGLIWRFYRDLLAYRVDPSPRRKAQGAIAASLRSLLQAHDRLRQPRPPA
jgi:hypothetical protein